MPRKKKQKQVTSPAKVAPSEFPEIHANLIKQYGLHVKDDFIRQMHNINKDMNISEMFNYAINKKLSSICIPSLPINISKQKYLKNKFIVEVCEYRDIRSCMDKQQFLEINKKENRMYCFTLTDGCGIKIKAIEYERIHLFDNINFYPSVKLQIENVPIRDEIMLLTPKNVLWVGGCVSRAKDKFIEKQMRFDKEQRIHEKALKKGETPPPKFKSKNDEGKYEDENEINDYQTYRHEDNDYNNETYSQDIQYNNNNDKYYDNNNNYNNNNNNNIVKPNNLQELYNSELPMKCILNIEIDKVGWSDKFGLLIDVKDNTGSCTGVSSEEFAQWVQSSYHKSYDALGDFFKDYGRKMMNVEVELNQAQLLTFHRFIN